MIYNQSEWYPLRNIFLNVTNGNFKRMLLMGRDHLDKLQAQGVSDPTILTFYQRLLPVYTAFSDAYNAVQTNYSLYQSHTLAFENKMAELSSTAIRRWSVETQMVFDEKSPAYLALFTNGREPFQTGAYELRISAIKALLDGMTAMNHPDLAATIQKIQLFYNEVQKLRTQQQGTEGQNSKLRQDLETRRIELAIEMHGIWFALGAIYYNNTATIDNFYELKYLRSSPSKSQVDSNTIIKTVVPAGNTVQIATGQYADTTNFNLANIGKVPLQIWLSNNAASAMPSNATQLAAGESGEFFGDELSDGSAPLQYLLAHNSDALAGSIGIEKG